MAADTYGMDSGGQNSALGAPPPPPVPPPPVPPPGIDDTTLLSAARAAAGLAVIDTRTDTAGSEAPTGAATARSDAHAPVEAAGEPDAATAGPASDARPTEIGPSRPSGALAVAIAIGVALLLAGTVGYVVGRDDEDATPAATLAPVPGESPSSSADAPTAAATGDPSSSAAPERVAPAFRYTWAADDGRAVDVTVVSATGDLLVRLDDGTAQRRVGGVWETRRPDGAWVAEPTDWEPPVPVERLVPTTGPLRPADVIPPAFDGFTLSRIGTTNPVGNRVVEITLDDVALNRHDAELRTFWMQRWGLDPSDVSVAPLVLIMVLTPDDMVRSVRIELTAHETGLNYDLVDVLDEAPSFDLP